MGNEDDKRNGGASKLLNTDKKGKKMKENCNRASQIAAGGLIM